jgi:hypothetical protein
MLAVQVQRANRELRARGTVLIRKSEEANHQRRSIIDPPGGAQILSGLFAAGWLKLR